MYIKTVSYYYADTITINFPSSKKYYLINSEIYEHIRLNSVTVYKKVAAIIEKCIEWV